MSKRILPITIALVSTALISVFLFLFIFRIKNIEIISDKPCVNQNQILETIKLESQSIFFFPQEKISIELKNKFSCIEEAKTIKIMPSTVKIIYKSKIPIAKIDSSVNKITLDGMIIATEEDSSNIPTIFLPNNSAGLVGQKITDPLVLSALRITDALLKSDFAPTNIRIVNDSITIYNQEDSVAIFSTKKSTSFQIDSLQKVLAKARIESKKISKIDMRFDNPIIIFK